MNQTYPPRVDIRELPDDTLLVFLSDSHFGGDPGRDGFEAAAEFSNLLNELAALDRPVELVLAGDFFDFLTIAKAPAGANRATATTGLARYHELFAALRGFVAQPRRRVTYMPGNHDAEMWWNPAIQKTLRDEGLVEHFALAYAARFTALPSRMVYCEHGNEFDPSNAVTDYNDPLDTPVGNHIVTDLLPRLVPSGDGAMARDLHDLNKVYPLMEVPVWLAGRLFYDLVSQICRLVILPLFIAYAAFRVLVYLLDALRDDRLSFTASARSAPHVQRLFIDLGVAGVLFFATFTVLFFVIRRLTGRVSTSVSANVPGVNQGASSMDLIRALLDSDRPMPMSGGLTGCEIDVFVSGHTHAPSLEAVVRRDGTRTIMVNSGCWLRQLRPAPAHAKAPPVFISTFVLTHVRIYVSDATLNVELWDCPKPATTPLSRVERLALLHRLPPQPPAGAEPAILFSAQLTPHGEIASASRAV